MNEDMNTKESIDHYNNFPLNLIEINKILSGQDSNFKSNLAVINGFYRSDFYKA